MTGYPATEHAVLIDDDAQWRLMGDDRRGSNKSKIIFVATFTPFHFSFKVHVYVRVLHELHELHTCMYVLHTR